MNHDTNAPLSGAVVYVSHTLVPGATAPMTAPSDGGETTTNSSGQYAMTLPAQPSYPARFFVEAFSSGMVTVHAVLTVTAGGAATAPTFGETTLTSDEANWLVLVNQDRAKWNVAPLVADETTEEVARLWVAWVGAGHFEHTCSSGDVNCPDKAGFEATEFADYTATAENLGQGIDDYTDVESQFMSEQQNCPQPTNPQTCPSSESTGHFLNIVSQTPIWYGDAEELSGMNSAGQMSPAYDQEFVYQNLSYGEVINAHRRAKGARWSVTPRPR